MCEKKTLVLLDARLTLLIYYMNEDLTIKHWNDCI